MLNAIIADARADLCAQETLFLRYSQSLINTFSQIVCMTHFLNGVFRLDRNLVMLKQDIDDERILFIPVSSVGVIEVLVDLEQEIVMLKQSIQSTEGGENLLRVLDRQFTDMNNAILAIKQIINEKILPQPVPA